MAINVVTMDMASEDVYDVIREIMPPEYNLVTLDTGTVEDRTEKARDCEFIITAVGAVPTEAIRNAKKLRMIQHQGVGVDKTDVDLATQLGIEICITPEGTSIGVAEHVVLLILSLYKNMRTIFKEMEAGAFPMWSLRTRSFEIYGKTVGLYGYGRIAREVAKRLAAFGAHIVFYDPYVTVGDGEAAACSATRMDSLDDMLAVSDIVSLHCPSTPESRGSINAAFFAKMKPTALFINTARGDLVNERDFFAAMRGHVIAGAGIDVFPKEPLPADNEYKTLPNVVLTPHCSAGTADALRCKLRHVFDNIGRFRNGEETWHSINKDRLPPDRRR